MHFSKKKFESKKWRYLRLKTANMVIKLKSPRTTFVQQAQVHTRQRIKVKWQGVLREKRKNRYSMAWCLWMKLLTNILKNLLNSEKIGNWYTKEETSSCLVNNTLVINRLFTSKTKIKKSSFPSDNTGIKMRITLQNSCLVIDLEASH